jgi:hypothetical protein
MRAVCVGTDLASHIGTVLADTEKFVRFSGNELPIAAHKASRAPAAPPSPQPVQTEHGKAQHHEHCGQKCQNVVNGMRKNVIWVARVKAVEAFKRCWQCC